MLPSWLSSLFSSVKTTNVFALIECVILAFIAVGGWLQLTSLQTQHRLERLFTGKSSVQRVNDLILRDYGDSRDDKENAFMEVLFPGMDPAEARKITAGYASLHAMEVLYLMNLTDNPENQKDFREFLREYLKNPEIRKWWGQETLHLAFGKGFREVVTQSIDQIDKEGTTQSIDQEKQSP